MNPADEMTIETSEMSDIEKIIASMQSEFAKTNSKIDGIQTTLGDKISSICDDVTKQSQRIGLLEGYTASDGRRIDALSYQIEVLKQDRLRNNIRLSGLPPVAYEKIVDTVMKTIKVLNLNLLPSDFVAYADRSHSAIIVAFENLSHKRYFIDTLRQRKGLLIEEILNEKSDAKLVCNDQLTPFFAQLFHKAWQAKRDGLIYAASSLGGRIKIRKNESSKFILVESEMHLGEIIASSEESTSAELYANNNNGSLNVSKSSFPPPQITNSELPAPAESQKRQLESASPSDSDFDCQQQQRYTHRNDNRNQRYGRGQQNHRYNGRTQSNYRRQNHQDATRHFDRSPNHPPSKKPTHVKSDRNNNRNSN